MAAASTTAAAVAITIAAGADDWLAARVSRRRRLARATAKVG